MEEMPTFSLQYIICCSAVRSSRRTNNLHNRCPYKFDIQRPADNIIWHNTWSAHIMYDTADSAVVGKGCDRRVTVQMTWGSYAVHAECAIFCNANYNYYPYYIVSLSLSFSLFSDLVPSAERVERRGFRWNVIGSYVTRLRYLPETDRP